MEEAALSAFLQVVFQSVANPLLAELRLILEADKVMESLTNELKLLEAFLGDAAQRQQTDEAVRLWLGNLQEVVYDAHNLFDECSFETYRRKLIPFAQVRNSASIINPKRIFCQIKISRRVRDVLVRLESMNRQSQCYGLQRWKEGSPLIITRSESTSLEPPRVIGREADEEIIKDLLMRFDDVGDKLYNTVVVCILGIGGLGKTTVAQRVYNDELISHNFAVRSWVHVSQDYNELKLTKAILESIDGVSHASMSLDNLQKMLLEKLRGRKFLLVLDDVWMEDRGNWQKMSIPLLRGDVGSKILVTTRSLKAAEAMGASEIYHLQPLNFDDWWSLFRHHMAQQNRPIENDKKMSSLPEFIAQNCNGLPSSAADLAFRVCQEPERTGWKTTLQVAMEEFLHVSEDSSQAGLSYELLPGHLKPCFALCAMFPKGFEFKKEELIHLWMAQSFIRPSDQRQRVEDLGSRYFDFLVGRLLLQCSHFNPKSNQFSYIMHDSIHKSARYASKRECTVLELGQSIEKEVRHVSLILHESPPDALPMNESSCSNLKGLYTLKVLSKSITEISDDFIKRFKRLRALDLSNTGLQKLPKSIDHLKHLRCLQLANTKIKMLPDDLGGLYLLQTIGLRNCYLLEKLPKETRNLQNLRHIDLRWDEDSMMMGEEDFTSRCLPRRRHCLKSMPPEIGLLTHLQTLSRFVVGHKNECGIGELKCLNDLHGELLISNLHLVRHAAEAKEANLRSKEHLQYLALNWAGAEKGDWIEFLRSFWRDNAENVLFELEPHPNLQGLRIVDYTGAYFPAWVGSLTFRNLTTLTLINCRRCQFLPQLGNLPHLTKLHVEGMEAVNEVNCGFCDPGNANPFPSLEKLHFENMASLQQWCGKEKCALRSLRELVIRNCPLLRKITHLLPSLEKMVIDESPVVSGFPTLNSLRCFEISSCDMSIAFPEDWDPTSLIYFGVQNCPELRLLPRELQKLTVLKELEIKNCPQLSNLPDQVEKMYSLARLEISDCPLICSLPSSLPSVLQSLSISRCPRLREKCLEVGGSEWTKIKNILSVSIDGENVVFSP